MKLVLQRVSGASVRVGGREVARIGKGLLVLAGVEKGDAPAAAEALARKVGRLRIFEDPQGKMNFSVAEAGGEVLVVSQFTLAADLGKGTRPGFEPAEQPELARRRIEEFAAHLKVQGVAVQQGEFGAKMQVELVNDGPVTFTLP